MPRVRAAGLIKKENDQRCPWFRTLLIREKLFAMLFRSQKANDRKWRLVDGKSGESSIIRGIAQFIACGAERFHWCTKFEFRLISPRVL
jgi:hypothetical protein